MKNIATTNMRRQMAEVTVSKAPAVAYNPNFSDITNLSAMGGAFDFLADEPDLYTKADVTFTYQD